MNRSLRQGGWVLSLLLALGIGCRPRQVVPVGTADPGDGAALDLRSKRMSNEVAYIPPMCWTQTEGAKGRVHNPCYTCHTASTEPNYRHDPDLQLSYAFPAQARTNPWRNLFESRAARVEAMPDAEIQAYIRRSNYLASDGTNLLAARLKTVPKGWDFDGNGRWDGYIPDVRFAFDDEGFDRTPEGGFTGWRAFAYAPFPGTFWPTNGSTGDVLIRMAPAFQQAAEGHFDRDIYRVNLALVEALVKRRDVPLDPVDEVRLGLDLDKDGRLGTARKVRYDWDPVKGRTMLYAGRAGRLQTEGKVHLAAGLFPEGTEFLHTVRYLDVTREGTVAMAPRLKELRYAQKRSWQTYYDLRAAAGAEVKEKRDFPDRLRTFLGDVEQGLRNGQGWVYQAFIEDRKGALRPQTYEETASCMGCHSGLGVTTDGTFAFARKQEADGFRRGWYHWTQKGLKGQAEPKVEIEGAGVVPEYGFYLQTNGAGDELRGNREVLARFFTSDGKTRPEKLRCLQDDISLLLLPSPTRAWQLNKAYRVLVQEQGFTRGRDATSQPAEHVHRSLKQDQPTGILPALNRAR